MMSSTSNSSPTGVIHTLVSLVTGFVLENSLRNAAAPPAIATTISLKHLATKRTISPQAFDRNPVFVATTAAVPATRATKPYSAILSPGLNSEYGLVAL